jgi:hypothetical protein
MAFSAVRTMKANAAYQGTESACSGIYLAGTGACTFCLCLSKHAQVELVIIAAVQLLNDCGTAHGGLGDAPMGNGPTR